MIEVEPIKRLLDSQWKNAILSLFTAYAGLLIMAPAAAESTAVGGNRTASSSCSSESNAEYLSDESYSHGNPSWSPDGQRIAFTSRRDGGADSEIYVVKPDGKGLYALTANEIEDRWPVWSPDGRWIAYASGPDMRNLDIYMVRSDGSQVRRLTRNGGYSGLVAWSPDQTRLLFYRADEDVNSNIDIFELNIASGQVNRVIANPSRDQVASYSPDGRSILFESTRDGDDTDLFILDSATGAIRTLTSNNHRDDQARWSPDGRKIAFNSDATGTLQLYVMNANGSALHQLTKIGRNSLSTWSSDATRLAFETTRNDYWEIYLINLDGSGERPLLLDRINACVQAQENHPG